MASAIITAKNQLTVPKEVREILRLRAGDLAHFVLATDGHVELRKVGGSVQALFGMLPVPSGARPMPSDDDIMGEVLAEEDARTRIAEG